MLGMVFGLVLGLLEGRLRAWLQVYARFHPCRWIHQISGGLVGASRSHQHLDACAGALFMIPLWIFVWMLDQIGSG